MIFTRSQSKNTKDDQQSIVLRPEAPEFVPNQTSDKKSIMPIITDSVVNDDAIVDEDSKSAERPDVAAEVYDAASPAKGSGGVEPHDGGAVKCCRA